MREAASRAGRPVAILQDLPGPKLRIGPLDGDIVELTAGDAVTFHCGHDEGAVGDARAHDDHAGPASPRALEPGEVLYLADGSSACA